MAGKEVEVSGEATAKTGKTGSDKVLMPRSRFSGKAAFVLAAAASAIGLGNLWRFPYLAAKYGGGCFLLVYVLLVVTLGFTLMVGEIALGRKTGQSVIGAYSHFAKKYTFIGVLAALVPFIITPYYCLIGGWVTKYMVAYVSEGAAAVSDSAYFTSAIINNPQSYLWLFVFLAAAVIIVALGVKNGIEKSNKILMPLLIAISVGISIYACTLPGGLDGLAYFFIPDFSKFSLELVVAAMGQMFFSLSLAMGIMVTYGSYFSPEESIEKSTRNVEVFDTLIAVLAGLMIIPAAFAVTGSGEAVASHAGPGLMFVILPQTFASLGEVSGTFLGFTFFLLVLFAALTSAVSLLEACVSIVSDLMHWSRRKSIAIVVAIIIVLAVIVNMGYNNWLDVDLMYSLFGIGQPGDHQLLDFFDFISNTIMMPLVAFLTCIFIGWIIKPQTIIDEVERNGHKFKAKKMFTVMTKYVAPICILMIMIGYVLSTVGVITL